MGDGRDPWGAPGPVLSHSDSEGNWDAVVVLFPATGEGVLAAANASKSMGGDTATRAALRALLPTLSSPA